MRATKALVGFLVAALAATTAMAQNRLDGTIEGTVRDSQGLVVPGATVTVSSPALIQTAVVTTLVSIIGARNGRWASPPR